MKLKKGDPVIVIAGKDKGREGEISRVIPKDGKVIVHGVNTAKKPIDASNVMYLHKGKATRLGYKVNADGTKVRVAKRTGDEI